MVDYTFLGFPKSVVQASDVDISYVNGNVSDEEKQLGMKVFAHFVSTQDKSYGAKVGQRLKMVEMNVWKKNGLAAYGETVFEIEVDKGE